VAALIKPAQFIVDPLQTAWELTPYSFVLDWVLNVGDALAATKLKYLASAYTASQGAKSVTTRTATVVAEKRVGYVHMAYIERYSGLFTKVTRYPTGISMQPSFTGRELSSDLVLDLRALVKGGKTPFARR
jgi:hypothetical protein